MKISCQYKSSECRSGGYARIFEQVNQKRFASFLQSKNSRTLPAEPSCVVVTHVSNHVKRNLAHLCPRKMKSQQIRVYKQEERAHVRRVQREACATAGPCSSDTCESRAGRRYPVCTYAFSWARRGHGRGHWQRNLSLWQKRKKRPSTTRVNEWAI